MAELMRHAWSACQCCRVPKGSELPFMVKFVCRLGGLADMSPRMS